MNNVLLFLKKIYKLPNKKPTNYRAKTPQITEQKSDKLPDYLDLLKK